MKASLSDYQSCAAAGLTMIETAERLGVYYSAVRQMARKHRISFPRKNRHGVVTGVTQSPELDGLSADQRRDAVTLISKGGYAACEAVATVTRPKVRIRFARVNQPTI